MPTPLSLRVQRHRNGLRAAGLRPLQFWVPDTCRPGFAAECRRQSQLVRDTPQEQETMDWLDTVRDTEGWD